MRRCLVLAAMMLIVSSPCYADEWAAVYKLDDQSYSNSIEQTLDGGYIVGGGTEIGGCILKLNPNGTIAWEKRLGNNNVQCIRETSDGDFILAGWFERWPSPDWGWVMKLDSNGTVYWQKSYGEGTFDSLQQTADGGFIVIGGYYIGGGGRVLKLDSIGIVEWGWIFARGESDNDILSHACQIADGGYVLAGRGSCSDGCDTWIVKLNPDGSIAWEKQYNNGNEAGHIWSLRQTSGGGCVFSTMAAGPASWVVQLNPDGTIAWQSTFDGIVDAEVQQTLDGGYVVGGSIYFPGSIPPRGWDTWIGKLNSDGTIISWQKAYGASKNETIRSIDQTSDGGYVLSGKGYSFRYLIEPILWVLKVNTDGEIPGCSLMTTAAVTSAQTSVTGQDTTTTHQAVNVTPSDTFVILEDTFWKRDVLCALDPTMPVITITNAYACDDDGNPKSVFRSIEPIQLHVEYDITGDQNTEYNVRGEVLVFRQYYDLIPAIGAHYPGAGYHTYKDRYQGKKIKIPGTIPDGKTKTIEYMLKLKESGHVLDINEATAQITIEAPYLTADKILLKDLDNDIETEDYTPGTNIRYGLDFTLHDNSTNLYRVKLIRSKARSKYRPDGINPEWKHVLDKLEWINLQGGDSRSAYWDRQIPADATPGTEGKLEFQLKLQEYDQGTGMWKLIKKYKTRDWIRLFNIIP